MIDIKEFQWKKDEIGRNVTPCCDFPFVSSPVHWDKENRVMRCANCGRIYIPAKYEETR